jgi:transcriptional regulator with XRE-family HTH domain
VSGPKDPTTASKIARTTLASNLIAARKAVGLTQAKLGENSGLGRAYIHRVENERTNLTLDSLAVLAATLGLSVSQLLSERGPEDGPLEPPSPSESEHSPKLVGSPWPAVAGHLALEFPAGQAFEAARVVASYFKRPVMLVDPLTRVVSGIAG